MKKIKIFTLFVVCLGIVAMLQGCESLGAGLGQAFGGENGSIIGRNLGHAFDLAAGANAGMVPAAPQPVVVVQQPQPVVMVAAQQPVVEESMIIAPAPTYGVLNYYPSPYYVAAYAGLPWAYVNEGGFVNLVYYRDGVPVYIERNWHEGGRMHEGMFHSWSRSYRISRVDYNRHRDEVRRHPETRERIAARREASLERRVVERNNLKKEAAAARQTAPAARQAAPARQAQVAKQAKPSVAQKKEEKK